MAKNKSSYITNRKKIKLDKLSGTVTTFFDIFCCIIARYVCYRTWSFASCCNKIKIPLIKNSSDKKKIVYNLKNSYFPTV